MSFVPESKPWPARRAIVLVHGVGSYEKKDYDRLLAALEAAVGTAEWRKIAVYTTLYDVFNDWEKEKLQCKALVEGLLSRLRFHFDSTALGEAAAEGAGDVVWPVLSLDARRALREAIIAQLKRVVLDGDAAGHDRNDQKITLIGHSLGCFHLYEALSELATVPHHDMQPVGDGVQFDNVLLFASPVKLIRSVSEWLGTLVPAPEDLACLKGAALARPGQRDLADRFVPSTRRFVSITGTLDPVGGYLFRKRLDWAYMDMPGQESHVDAQASLGIPDEQDLRARLLRARTDPRGLAFTPDNPHDWVGYVDRNRGLVKECVLS